FYSSLFCRGIISTNRTNFIFEIIQNEINSIGLSKVFFAFVLFFNFDSLLFLRFDSLFFFNLGFLPFPLKLLLSIWKPGKSIFSLLLSFFYVRLKFTPFRNVIIRKISFSRYTGMML